MKSRGFSYLEVLLVTSMVSILVVIAVPRISQLLVSWQMDYEAACLATDLRYLQELSREERRPLPGFELPGRSVERPALFIEFDGTRDGYYIHVPGQKTSCRHICPPGVLMGNGSVYVSMRITFEADGSILGPRTIYLYKDHQMERRIIIDQAGRIRVERESGNAKTK